MTVPSNRGLCFKFKRVLEFISLLNVEPFIFFHIINSSLKKVPTDQLIQDKICLFEYHLKADYCLDLPKMSAEEDVLNKKSTILAELTEYSLYTTLISTVPMLLASLLVGSWTDKYVSAKKALFIAGAVTGIVESLILLGNVYFYSYPAKYVLLNLIPSCLVGGQLAIYTAFWSYIASTTPPRYRAMRMLVAEVVVFTGSPIGSYIGGKLLNLAPLMKHGQLYNYTLVFTIGGAANLIALIWVLIRVNEKKDIKEFKNRFHIRDDSGRTVDCEKQKQFDDNKHIHPLRLLLSLGNVKDMIRTCCKPRANYVRLQIWMLFLTMLCYMVAHNGSHAFLYPFCQKVYEWNSETYSSASAMGNAINALSTLILAPILIKIMKVKDTTLSLIGLTAYFTQNMIRGLVLTEQGFYISLLPGALGSITSVGIRTHFSKIVEPKELGKVFSLMSAIDSLAPLMSSAVFTNVFKQTMDTFPGLSFLIICVMLLIPYFVTFWIDLYTVLPNSSVNQCKEINNNIKYNIKM